VGNAQVIDMIHEKAVYWIWLALALGEGADIKEIIADFGGAEQLYHSNIMEWRMSSALVSKQIDRLEKTDIREAEKILAVCERNHWQVICYEDDKYPERLRQIHNPPAVLYADGVLPDIDRSVLIGIVGTRKASDYALKSADVMSRGICQGGGIVVSGGALGVDTAAHNGAILSGGKTIAVLGCGLGTNYLMENKPLRDAVKNNGALITEYPPFTKASRYTFPLRNRIISGISLGVLVVEAGVKSGSLITANHALEQNRDVYAVPCSILESNFTGTNKLIGDGAVVALNPIDLLYPYAEEYGLDLSGVKSSVEIVNATKVKNVNAALLENSISFENTAKTRAKREKNRKTSLSLSGNSKTVFDVLTDEFTHIDIITQRSGLSAQEVLSALTVLEIAELAESAGGKRYKLS